MNSALYEVELAKAQIEHKEPIIVGFFILQYAKHPILALYHNLFTTFCDVNKFEELEIETDSLYLALAKKELENCIRAKRKAEWKRLRLKDCTVCFTADAVGNFFPRMCCDKHRKTWQEPGFFKEEFRCSERLCLCGKTYCCHDKSSNKLKFSSKCFNKRIL